MSKNYTLLAQDYCKRNGIFNFQINNNILIYTIPYPSNPKYSYQVAINLDTMKKDYAMIALLYCEEYGIVEYKVNGNTLVYNVSFPAYLNNPRYTVQHTINLDDMSHSSRQLKRYDPKGALNRG